MSEVEVTMRALLDASTGIDTIISDLSDGEARQIDELGTADYGHDTLPGQVRQFAEAWSYGVTALTRDAVELSEALHDSANTYAEAEQINIDQFLREQ